MGSPRQIFKGATYLITRRCTQRLFLIIPSETINQVLRFCMIHAATMNNIQIHAFAFLSNHYHIVLTDPDRNLPLFQEWMNRFSAKCINSMLGRWENLWAAGSYSAVRLNGDKDLTAPEDILDKIVYTLTNPVAAGLVDRSYKWPGLWSSPNLMSSGHIEAKRPSFFKATGSIPEKVSLSLSPPPGFPGMTPEEFSGLVYKRVREREDEIQICFKNEGRTFLGAKRVRSQSYFNRPASHEPRRNLNPRIACKDKWKRIELLRRVKEFLKEYREAFIRFCGGDREAVFPAGTFKMRILYNVQCESQSQAIPIST